MCCDRGKLKRVVALARVSVYRTCLSGVLSLKEDLEFISKKKGQKGKEHLPGNFSEWGDDQYYLSGGCVELSDNYKYSSQNRPQLTRSP